MPLGGKSGAFLPMWAVSSWGSVIRCVEKKKPCASAPFHSGQEMVK